MTLLLIPGFLNTNFLGSILDCAAVLEVAWVLVREGSGEKSKGGLSSSVELIMTGFVVILDLRGDSGGT